MMKRRLCEFVKADAHMDWSGSIPIDGDMRRTPAIEANARYFDTPEWTLGYLHGAHRDAAFKERWTAATGSWDGKIVVDVGCGPGNLFVALGGKPSVLIGVDVSSKSLEIASANGYEPLLADAHHLPLKSGFADIVAINATLHHCENMERVLAEAARLVAPGGLLITDHDPQLGAWNFRWLGRVLWDSRLPIFRLTGRGQHASFEQQAAALASEIHHVRGDGVTRALFESVLGPMGFSVEVFPHNHRLGRAVLDHQHGRAAFKYRLGQRLSLIDPDASGAALSLMCRARLPSPAN